MSNIFQNTPKYAAAFFRKVCASDEKNYDRIEI